MILQVYILKDTHIFAIYILVHAKTLDYKKSRQDVTHVVPHELDSSIYLNIQIMTYDFYTSIFHEFIDKFHLKPLIFKNM